jgi:hypothetical protein
MLLIFKMCGVCSSTYTGRRRNRQTPESTKAEYDYDGAWFSAAQMWFLLTLRSKAYNGTDNIIAA